MFTIGSALDKGRRRSGGPNQDALCVLPGSPLGKMAPLLVLADGMGGYAGGAVASQLVVSSFTDVYLRADGSADPLQTLHEAVTASLQALRQQAGQQPILDRMGSTVVAAVLLNHAVHLLNVGDSRAYLVNEKQIRQLSVDHSLAGEQLRQGLITEGQLRAHPRRNVLSMSLNAQRLEVETFANVFPWQPGDCLVLCSDGLWGPVSEPQIQESVLLHPPQQAAERLVQLANANQGPDNISVIVARRDI